MFRFPVGRGFCPSPFSGLADVLKNVKALVTRGFAYFGEHECFTVKIVNLCHRRLNLLINNPPAVGVPRTDSGR